MTLTPAPNCPNAETIRRTLKNANITTPVRITTSKWSSNITKKTWDSPDLTQDEINEIVEALRPLWNDERVTSGVNFISIDREDWQTTAPLWAELDLLQENGVPRGRIAELREDSTRAERIAELDAVASKPLELIAGSHYYRLAAVDDHRLLQRHVREENFQTLPAGSVLEEGSYRRRLVHSLLVAVIKRRHPIRRPQRVS